MGRLVWGEEGGRSNKDPAINMKITWLMDLVTVISGQVYVWFLWKCSEDLRAVVLLGLRHKEKNRDCLA